jgi:hypothetical protein
MANYAILCHLAAHLANAMLPSARHAIQPDSFPEPAEMKAHPTSPPPLKLTSHLTQLGDARASTFAYNLMKNKHS